MSRGLVYTPKRNFPIWSLQAALRSRLRVVTRCLRVTRLCGMVHIIRGCPCRVKEKGSSCLSTFPFEYATARQLMSLRRPPLLTEERYHDKSIDAVVVSTISHSLLSNDPCKYITDHLLAIGPHKLQTRLTAATPKSYDLPARPRPFEHMQKAERNYDRM